jgi:hypothetical protein
MKEYEVNITETASRIVTVTASSAEMARRIVRDRYCDDEIVLDYSDHDSVDFEVIED